MNEKENIAYLNLWDTTYTMLQEILASSSHNIIKGNCKLLI